MQGYLYIGGQQALPTTVVNSGGSESPIKEWYNWRTPLYTWSTGSLPTQMSYSNIAYGNNIFVITAAGNGGGAAYSSDGTNWTEVSLPSGGNYWSTMTYGNGKFVVIGGGSTNASAYSTDGSTWTFVALPSTGYWGASSIKYCNDRFMICKGTTLAYSTDGGSTWQTCTVPFQFTEVSYGNGVYVGIGNGTASSAYSTDGINWVTTSLPETASWNSIDYGNGKFIAIAGAVADWSDPINPQFTYSTIAACSTDGINWTSISLPIEGDWFKIIYANNTFVAIEGGNYGGSNVLYSADGINWSASVIGSGSWSSICYGANKFIAVELSNSYSYISGFTFEVFTDTPSPSTSSTVYSVPFTASALTITLVGTGTITCSDTRVYNRNSTGDEDSVMNITQNGTYDVTQYVSAVVDVPVLPTKKYNLLDRVKDDNNNEIGTVVGFFTDANNVEYAVVCADAQYRDNNKSWCSDASALVSNLPVYDNLVTSNPWTATDTAEFNTQTIESYCIQSGFISDACDVCRRLYAVIDGITYLGALPNAIECEMIAKHFNDVELLDPSDPMMYASMRFTQPKLMWSSSQSAYNSAYYLYGNGFIATGTKTSATRFVCPVLEIPNT